jgi:hypothetical protein
VRAEHPHERVEAEFFVGKPALQQPNELGQTGVEVQFFGLAERLGLRSRTCSTRSPAIGRVRSYGCKQETSG